jgi:hypothetical protein
MNWKKMTNYELIDLIATRLKYSMQICKRLERTHKNIDFRALENGMNKETPPKEYYQMQVSFKMYKKSELMSILMAIKAENKKTKGNNDE